MNKQPAMILKVLFTGILSRSKTENGIKNRKATNIMVETLNLFVAFTIEPVGRP